MKIIQQTDNSITIPCWNHDQTYMVFEVARILDPKLALMFDPIKVPGICVWCLDPYGSWWMRFDSRSGSNLVQIYSIHADIGILNHIVNRIRFTDYVKSQVLIKLTGQYNPESTYQFHDLVYYKGFCWCWNAEPGNETPPENIDNTASISKWKPILGSDINYETRDKDWIDDEFGNQGDVYIPPTPPPLPTKSFKLRGFPMQDALNDELVIGWIRIIPDLEQAIKDGRVVGIGLLSSGYRVTVSAEASDELIQSMQYIGIEIVQDDQ